MASGSFAYTRLSDLDGDLSLIENGEDVLDVPLHVESEHNLESYVPPTPDSSVAHIPAIPHKWFSPSQYLKFVTVFAGISGLLFGYDLGVITGALLMMKVAFNLSDGQEELVVSLVVAGSVIGSIGAGILNDVWGRWRSILVANVAFILGSLMLTMSPTSTLAFVYTGRTIVGLAIGVLPLTATLYIAELAPLRSRGMLVAVNEICIVVGIFGSFIINYIVSDLPVRLAPAAAVVYLAHAWQILNYLGAFFLPFSPRWLMYKGRESEALAVLYQLRESYEAQEEFDNIRNTRALVVPSLKESIKELFSSSMRKPLMISASLCLLQQAIGQPTVLAYASRLIKMNSAFQSSTRLALMVSLLPGGVKVLATALSAFVLLDKVGRKPSLLLGSAGMTGTLVIMTIAMGVDPSDAASWVLVLALTVYVAGYAVSFGPISWLVMAEVYPQHVRSIGMAFSVTVNWVGQLIVSMTFLTAINSIGASGTFLIYAAFGVAAFAWIWYKIPETSGKSLEQLSAELSTN